MTLKLFLLIIVSVVLSALAQVMLKAGMSSATIQGALMREGWFDLFGAVATNARVLVGLSLYGLSVAFWLLVLAKADVSFAYPFVGLGFVLTMLFGFLFLAEAVSIGRVVGTLLVALGVVFIART